MHLAQNLAGLTRTIYKVTFEWLCFPGTDHERWKPGESEELKRVEDCECYIDAHVVASPSQTRNVRIVRARATWETFREYPEHDEVSDHIRESASKASSGNDLLAAGIAAVGLDDEGRIVRYEPDETSTPEDGEVEYLRGRVAELENTIDKMLHNDHVKHLERDEFQAENIQLRRILDGFKALGRDHPRVVECYLSTDGVDTGDLADELNRWLFELAGPDALRQAVMEWHNEMNDLLRCDPDGAWPDPDRKLYAMMQVLRQAHLS
jgi:hypothetical protein